MVGGPRQQGQARDGRLGCRLVPPQGAAWRGVGQGDGPQPFGRRGDVGRGPLGLAQRQVVPGGGAAGGGVQAREVTVCHPVGRGDGGGVLRSVAVRYGAADQHLTPAFQQGLADALPGTGPGGCRARGGVGRAGHRRCPEGRRAARRHRQARRDHRAAPRPGRRGGAVTPAGVVPPCRVLGYRRIRTAHHDLPCPLRPPRRAGPCRRAAGVRATGLRPYRRSGRCATVADVASGHGAPSARAAGDVDRRPASLGGVRRRRTARPRQSSPADAPGRPALTGRWEEVPPRPDGGYRGRGLRMRRRRT